MSRLSSTLEEPNSKSCHSPTIKSHLLLARQAYERLVPNGAIEENKNIDSEEPIEKYCIQLLIEKGLAFTTVEGDGLVSFTNALMQHATGNYIQESFLETKAILDSMVINLETFKSDLLQHSVLQDIIEAVNKLMNTNLLVCILAMFSSLNPDTIAEIGSKSGDPVVIWYRKEGHFSSVIISQIQDDQESDDKPESQDTNSSSSITLNYRQELRLFKRQIYDIANPLIAREILYTLSSITSLSSSEGILPLFSNLPEEIYEALKSLSQEISKLLLNNPDKLDELKQRIIEDMNNLSRDVEIEDEPWEELALLLEIPAIRGLPNIDVKKIKHHIYKGTTTSLRECLDSLIKIRNLDINEISSTVSQTDYEDLETLLGEIMNNKPKKKEDLLSFWNMKADFFINKTFYIELPEGETYSGLIQDTYKIDESFYFMLHDNTKLKVCRDSTSITTETCLPLWTAYKEGKLINKVFEIRLPKSFEEYTNNMILPGKYKIEKHYTDKSTILKIPKEFLYIRNINKWKKYCIKATSNNSKTNRPSFQIFRLNKRDMKKSTISMQYTEFQKSYIGVVENERKYDCDPSRHIAIRDEIDENQYKMKYFKEIYTDIESLRIQFSKEETKDLLDSLLDSLITNGLNKLDLEILSKSGREDLVRKLEKISNNYKNNLKSEQQPEDVLKQIVIDANYSRIINKSQGVEVSKAMDLLKQAFKNIEEIKGKDIILFIGNTGSGKSTTISYLLGADLEYFYNKTGDQVVRVKDESSLANFPIIGQSLGESETLYTKGYSLPPQYKLPSSVLITDCPGFSDTRGGHYELCTYLSIDQTIKHCANIKAIVIAFPIQAFQLDRSNPVQNLIESVIERFSETFNVDNPQGNTRVFLLITKSSQAPQGVVEKIKDGSRFQELYSEASARYKSICESGKDDKFELEIAERKKKLWQVLVRMHNSKQIDVIDIKNKIQRKKLLEKYSISYEFVNKGSYEGLMKSRDMQIKFGKYIEMSTHTWTHLIFKEYLETLPNSIKASQEKIESNLRRISELNQAKISKIEEHKEKTKKLEEQLHRCKSDQGRNELINLFTDELKPLDKQIEEVKVKLANTSSKISQLESQILEIKQKINEHIRDIDMLSKGSRVEVLYEEDYRGRENEIIKMYQHESSEVQAAFKEIRELEDSPEGTIERKANSISGTIIRVKVFEKVYKLIPSDDSLRRKFERHLKYVSGDAKYEAKVQGEGISDIRFKANGDGKKIAYHFILKFKCKWYYWLTWRNPVMPWIRISHETPNIEFNEAAIINKNAIINQLHKQKAELEKELYGIDEKNNKYTQLKQLEMRVSQLTNMKDSMIDEYQNSILSANLESLTRKLDEYNNERDHLIIGTEIELEIENICKENTIEEEKTDQILKRKKHLAIIIKTKIDTARLIREFTQIVIEGREEENIQGTSETSNSCLEFNHAFDSSIDRLILEVEQDLYLRY
jgi:hypothetical protein